jgi:glycosyltransferase involved in cell wall biosynthesis
MKDYILHIPSWFPDEKNPYSGNFIEKHIKAISRFRSCITLRVVAVSKKKAKQSITRSQNHILIEYFYEKKNGLLSRILGKIKREYLYYKALREIKDKYGIPILLHLHVALPMGKFAVWAAQKWSVPLILTEHWTIYQPQNQHAFIAAQRKLKKVFSNCWGFTAVSMQLQNRIEALFHLTRGIVIPNVVDTNLFNVVSSQSKTQKTMILHVSTLNDKAKNIMGILRAIKQLSQQRNDFELHIIHEKRNLNAEKYILEYQLSNVVKFLGSKTESEVAVTMQHCAFLLLFSNYENMPCVIEEAFACGKPVLTTPVGGIPEIVNEERGRFVESKDEVGLKNSIDWMLDNYNTYDAENLRKFAVEHFSSEIIGQQFDQFVREITD